MWFLEYSNGRRIGVGIFFKIGSKIRLGVEVRNKFLKGISFKLIF